MKNWFGMPEMYGMSYISKWSGRWVLFLIAGAGLLLPAPDADGRPWTNAQGRTFEAEFVRFDGANVIFALENGREFATPLADLSKTDQALLRSGRMPGGVRREGIPPPVQAAPLNFGRPWPREIRVDGAVDCKVISEDRKAGRFVYESPGYRFSSNARITDDALRNFSVMFETTRKYARTVPLSLGGGRERGGKLDILLFANMHQYIQAGGAPGSAGCFVPTSGVVMVPMESLGLREGGTGFRLDVKKKNNVLIHELVHQLTPDAYFAPGAMGWFSEGIAEYMSVTPYNWGYFGPDIHGNVVKSHVTGNGSDGTIGRGLGMNLSAPPLRTFFLMPYREFSGANGNFNYGMSLLLTHYFLHMEGDGGARRITQFLKGLHEGKRGEAALSPLLGGSTYEKLESDISTAWAKTGVQIRFGD